MLHTIITYVLRSVLQEVQKKTNKKAKSWMLFLQKEQGPHSGMTQHFNAVQRIFQKLKNDRRKFGFGKLVKIKCKRMYQKSIL